MSKQFCEVCLKENDFKRITIEEEVIVKGIKLVVNHEYDVCENCKEYFEPYEDIDINLKNDYRAYREKLGFLQPEKIKEIREKYHMNLRQFAELLGIGYSTLSHIENGSLQSWYQNSLFVLVKSPKAMLSLLQDRMEYTEEKFEDVIKITEKLLQEEEEEFYTVAKELEETIDWISERNEKNTKKLEDLEIGIKEITSKDYTSVSKKERLFSWDTIINTFSLS